MCAPSSTCEYKHVLYTCAQVYLKKMACCNANKWSRCCHIKTIINIFTIIILQLHTGVTTKGKDKNWASYTVICLKKMRMTKRREEKEILKINMTCLYLRVNYCMSIVLEMKPGPKIRQTWVQKIAPAFIISVASGEWLNSYRSQLSHL